MRSLVNPQNPPTGLGTPVIIRADGISVPEGPSTNAVIAGAVKTISVKPIQNWCPAHRGRSFLLPIVGLTCIAILSGCAGVRVTPLNPDGTAAAGAKEGMRYYMPAPYLLVARMPPLPSPSSSPIDSDDSQDLAPNDVQAAQSKKSPTSKPSRDTKKDGEEPSSAPAGGAPSSNTSFLASTPQYMLKLVYLPDKTKPMAMSVRTGLFGTASMKPALQDGWMLTSLDASADSKTAETLTAIASLVSSAATAGVGGAAKNATKSKDKDLASPIPPDFSRQILKPGLYKFVYGGDGELIGLHAVTYFEDTGVTPDVDVITARAVYGHRTTGK